MKHFLVAGLLACSTLAVFAFTPSSPISTAQAQAQRLPIAVLNLSAKGSVSEPEASIITDRIRTLVVQTRRFEVMERESMDKILREQGFQTTQDCESNACSVEIGRLLSVRAIVTGSVSRLGNLYTLSLRIVDVERGTILKEDFVDCSCPLETLLVEKTGELLRRLLNEGQINNPAASPSASPSPDQRTDSAEKLTIRRQRPFLATLEGGLINYGGIGLQYNIGDYIALRLAAGWIQYSSIGFLDGLNTYAYDYPTLSLSGGLRFYFSPEPLTGFAEAYFSHVPFLAARVGIEQRYDNGLTWLAAAGWGFGAGSRMFGAFDGMVGLGYAF